jgi:hypothetical protein
MTEEKNTGASPVVLKKVLGHIKKDRGVDEVMEGGMKRPGETVPLQISGGLKAQPGYPDRRSLELEKTGFEPLNRLFQRQGSIDPVSPERFERRPSKNQSGMDPDEIGFQIDDPIKGLLETIECVPRKTNHQLVANLKTFLFQTSSSHAGVLCSMPSLRS